MAFVKDFFLLLGRTVTPIHNEEALIYADVMESEYANYIV